MSVFANVSNTVSSSPLVEQEGRASTAFQKWIQQVSLAINGIPPQTFSGTIATAKLTGGGANGSITFTNGVVTAQVPAT